MTHTPRNYALFLLSVGWVTLAIALHPYSLVITAIMMGGPAYAFAAGISNLLGWHDE